MENLNPHIESIRKDYIKTILSEENVDEDPIMQFTTWMNHAVTLKVEEPNAMTLSTINNDGFPEGRIVLLRGIFPGGFCFYTNYNSEKGKNIAANPKVSLTLFWPELERQVRITGTAEKVPKAQSDQYFKTRPRSSQLGAWASAQSEVLKSREELEEREKKLMEEYQDADIPRPPHWGGYLVKPLKIEFWQGRPSRLHDRILYKLQGEKWKISRLSP